MASEEEEEEPSSPESFTTACDSFHSSPSSSPVSSIVSASTSTPSPCRGAPEIEEIASKRWVYEVFGFRSIRSSRPQTASDWTAATPMIYTSDEFQNDSRTIITRDAPTGKITYFVSTNDTWIPLEGEYSQRKTHPNSWFVKAAQISSTYWVEVNGYIDLSILSPRTTYNAYLICKPQSHASDLGTWTYPKHTTIVVKNAESTQEIQLHADELKLNLRDDGWNELALGKFYNFKGREWMVQVRWMSSEGTWTKGIIVQGVEFRPKKKSVTSMILHAFRRAQLSQKRLAF